MKHPVTILFVSHTSGLYGAERSLLSLVIALNSQEEIKPIVLLPNNGPLKDALIKNKISVLVFGKYRWWISKNWQRRILLGPIRITWTYISAWLFSKLFRSIKPALIFSNTAVCPMGLFIAKISNLPHIIHIREFVKEDIGQNFDLGDQITMKIIAKSRSIISNSQAVKNKLSMHINSSKITVIYNGFSFESLNNSSPEEKHRCYTVNKQPGKLVIVGSLSPGKGQHDAIKALHELISQGISITLTIVGTGDIKYKKYLIDLSKTLKVSDHIHWAGQVNDTKKYFNDALITIVCSRAEAFGRVAVESMAQGTPVVVANSGGLGEIVKHQETGLLYLPGNIKSLTEQIKQLLYNPELYKYLAKNSENHIRERFSMQQYVEGIKKEILSSIS